MTVARRDRCHGAPAQVHPWNVAHGVAGVTAGERISLILFCHQTRGLS